MRMLLRRYAEAMAVILALTVLLTGSSLVSARAKQTLTGVAQVTVRVDSWSAAVTELGRAVLRGVR